MSPEQAKGSNTDPRSDIFSFGCVLYEMLTGRQAFDGETVSEVLASVLKSEPDWNLLPKELNPKIRDLLRRCLEKKPRRRWYAAGDVRLEIEALLADPHGTAIQEPPRAPSSPLWRRTMPLALAVVVGALIAGVAVWSVRPSNTAPVTRLSFVLPEDQQFTASAHPLAISPDGTKIVYVANSRLYIRSLSDNEPKPIPGTETQDPVNPVFSPDTASIAFYSITDRALKRIAVAGGAAITIAQVPANLGTSWEEDGIVFINSTKTIMRAPANSGKPQVLVSLKGDEAAQHAQLLPAGQAVLFDLASGADADRWERAQVIVQSLGSGVRKTLVSGTDPRYLSSGRIAYALGGTIFVVPFDIRRLEVTGEPVPVIEGVQRASSGSSQFSVSKTGSLAYIPGPAAITQQDLGLIDRKGNLQPLKLPAGRYETPRVSPDGKRIAFGSNNGKEANIWIYDLSGAHSMRQLTFGGRNRFPVWSSNGDRVAFQSDREGDLGIFWQRADGSGVERLTKAEQGTAHIPESGRPRLINFFSVKSKRPPTRFGCFLFRIRSPVALVTCSRRIQT